MTEKFIKVFAILSFILPLATIGQAQINKNSEFEIPFDFVIKDKVMPAGEYILRSANDQKTGWTIERKASQKTKVFLLANTVEVTGPIDVSKLSFQQYGDLYFLAEFTVSDYRITLPKAKAAQVLQRESLARHKTAMVAGKITLYAR